MVSEALAAVEMRLATYQQGAVVSSMNPPKLFLKRRPCQSMLKVAIVRNDCSEADPTLRAFCGWFDLQKVRRLSGG